MQALANTNNTDITEQYKHFTDKWGSMFEGRLELAIESRKRAIVDCEQANKLDNIENTAQWQRWQDMNKEQLAFWLELRGYHAATIAINQANPNTPIEETLNYAYGISPHTTDTTMETIEYPTCIEIVTTEIRSYSKSQLIEIK